MTQRTLFKIVCPACRSGETQHEVADRWQCENCGYRFLVDDDGNVKDFMPWKTAGKKRKRRVLR